MVVSLMSIIIALCKICFLISIILNLLRLEKLTAWLRTHRKFCFIFCVASVVGMVSVYFDVFIK